MKKEWRNALGYMTYGIYVLTVKNGSDFNGMIASWVTQVSYDPPLIMAAVHKDRYSNRLISGNHTLFIGEVINCGVDSQGTPLSTIEYDKMYIGKK